MNRNGTLTAHGRTWPLYERVEMHDGREVLVLFMAEPDRAEKEALDREAMRFE